jgi:hypothetical protein
MSLRAGDTIRVRLPRPFRQRLGPAILRGRPRPCETEAVIAVIETGPHGGLADCEPAGFPGLIVSITFGPDDLADRTAEAGWAA